MANYGLNTVIPADEDATDEDESFFLFCRAYAEILTGENFVALPEESNGAAVTWKEQLTDAVTDLDNAISLTSETSYQQTYTLLKARVYRMLGDGDNAVTYAKQVLSDDILYQVEYDGENDVNNDMQTAIFTSTSNMFAPLPRLDFLDPKYFHTGSSTTGQKPVSIVKTEEAYLILAEVYAVSDKIESAKSTLKSLLSDVIANREISQLDDSNDTRTGSIRDDYPTTAVKVRFSSSDTLRSGYVLDRQAGDITAYPVSGTKVTDADIDNASSEDDMLYIIYRMRQEIFISEGRRMADIGIRFPISQTEQQNNPNIEEGEYTTAQIPSFIPLDGAMDDFSTDAESRNVTMTYDMNQVIVDNKTSEYVLPFNN